MNVLFWQELLLIIIAVIIGMVIGYYLHKTFKAKADETAGTTDKAIIPETELQPSMPLASQTAQAYGMSEQSTETASAEPLAKAQSAAPKAKGTEKIVEEDAPIVVGEQPAGLSKEALAAKPKQAAEEKVAEEKKPVKQAAEAVVTETAKEKIEPVKQAEPVKEAKKPASKPAAKTEDIPAIMPLASLPAEENAEAKPASEAKAESTEMVGAEPALLKAPRAGKADDLKKIKGVGKVIENKLNDLGVYHYDQVADWSDKEIAWVDDKLAFKGRIERENWIPQAKALASAAPADAKATQTKPAETKADKKPATAGTEEKAKTAPAKKAQAKKKPAQKAEPEPAPEPETEPVDLAAEEERMAQALAALPADASIEDKANAVGSKPPVLAKPRKGSADDLKRIKGVGKVIEGKLNDLGIYHFDQVASWKRSEVNWVTTFLSFKGRIDREDWIVQAKSLAAGEETEFSKRVDKGQVKSSTS